VLTERDKTATMLKTILPSLPRAVISNPIYIDFRDRQTDGQSTYGGNTVLCTV